MADKIPKPGSEKAVSIGCTCAVIDNYYGRGHRGDGARYGWIVSEGCPVHMATPLSKDELAELRLLWARPSYGGSDRQRDRMRTKLKKRGIIRFDRANWKWELLPAALRALDKEREG